MAACWEGAGGSEDDVRGPLSRLPKVDLGLILTHSVRLPKGAEKHEREAGSKREQRGKKKKKKRLWLSFKSWSMFTLRKYSYITKNQ